MRTVEFTRGGDDTLTEQISQMRRWLDKAGITAGELKTIRILKGRVTFSATFDDTADATRFLSVFAEGSRD